jgi:hypothetical protein
MRVHAADQAACVYLVNRAGLGELQTPIATQQLQFSCLGAQGWPGLAIMLSRWCCVGLSSLNELLRPPGCWT